MNDRARRIANLSPEQRRHLELMLQERARGRDQEARRADEGIQALPRCAEGGQPAVFPLSSAQRQLWFAEQRQPGDATHNVAPALMRLRGPLDVAALEAGLREICVRHEALRMTFGTREREPVQTVGPPRPVPLTRFDLRELPPPEDEAEANRLLVREALRPFDLARDLLLRAALVRLDDEEHLLLPVMSHMVFDGWSTDILYRELWALYKAPRSGERASLPELPVQYADYAVWQRQRLQEDEALRRQMEYWRKQLADAPLPKTLDMPTDHPRPRVRTLESVQQDLRMPTSLVRELRVLSRRQEATLYMTLLASWATLLYRYSGQEDILIGTPFANRNRAEVEGLIGFFANFLVLRHDLSGDPPFVELLGRVRETVVDAFSHGEVPFEKLIEELNPRFRATFTLRNSPRSSLKLDGLQVERIEVDYGGRTQFLGLIMIEDEEGLTARLDYSPDLFEPATITRMLRYFRSLLESIVADPQQRISELPLPIEAEQPAATSVAAKARHQGRAVRPAGSWQTQFRERLLRAARHARRAAGRYLGSLRRAGRR